MWVPRFGEDLGDLYSDAVGGANGQRLQFRYCATTEAVSLPGFKGKAFFKDLEHWTTERDTAYPTAGSDDTWDFMVNFMPQGSPLLANMPAGWLPDTGEALGKRTGGKTYGWSKITAFSIMITCTPTSHAASPNTRTRVTRHGLVATRCCVQYAPESTWSQTRSFHSLCSFSCLPIIHVHILPSCRLVPLARRRSSAYLSSPAPLTDCDISDPIWLSGQSKNTTSVYYKNKYMQQAGYIFNADGWNEYNREKTNTDISDHYEKLEDEPTLDNTMVLMKWRKSERCPRRSLNSSLPATVVGSSAQRVIGDEFDVDRPVLKWSINVPNGVYNVSLLQGYDLLYEDRNTPTKMQGECAIENMRTHDGDGELVRGQHGNATSPHQHDV